VKSFHGTDLHQEAGILLETKLLTACSGMRLCLVQPSVSTMELR